MTALILDERHQSCEANSFPRVVQTATQTAPLLAAGPNRVATDSDWLEAMVEASGELRWRICEERWRLEKRFWKTADGETIARISLGRRLPREVWMLLLWNPDWSGEPYQVVRDALLTSKTVLLRKHVDVDAGKKVEWVGVYGPGGQQLSAWFANELFAGEDAAVHAWTLLLAGIRPEDIRSLTTGSLPPR